jgi:hypothetical protein
MGALNSRGSLDIEASNKEIVEYSQCHSVDDARERETRTCNYANPLCKRGRRNRRDQTFRVVGHGRRRMFFFSEHDIGRRLPFARSYRAECVLYI